MPSPMRLECIRNIERFASILPPGINRVLDVGIAGDVKPSGNFYLFSKAEFETMDIDPQYGATYTDDICEPVNTPADHFDLVIVSNTIEHTLDPYMAIVGARNLLKKGGYLIIDCPWQYPYHAEDNFPDCWRISIDGMNHLLKRADMEVVDCTMGLITSAIAFKL